METDKRYFFEGLFIAGFALALALFAVWLTSSGHRDDVVYRVRFAESVSGLSLGDPVKFQGVDVGNVRAIALDRDDPRLVQVDVALRKDTPVKIDTKATLKLKGITGVVYIELEGGAPEAQALLAATTPGQVPEIPAERSAIATVIDELPTMIAKFSALGDELPKVVGKFSALEDRAGKVVGDVNSLTSKLKENPSLLLRGPKEKEKEKSGLGGLLGGH